MLEDQEKCYKIMSSVHDRTIDLMNSQQVWLLHKNTTVIMAAGMGLGLKVSLLVDEFRSNKYC